MAEVFILGQKYALRGDATDEHIAELARLVEGRINEVVGRYPDINPTQALILALFNIADELHRLRREQEDLTKTIEEKASLLSGLFD